MGWPAGTLAVQVNADASPGATTSLACVAYAIGEYQPDANAAFVEVTLQVTLSAAQTARFTCELVLRTHAVAPEFRKKTEKDPVSPGCRARNALSNW